MFGFSPALRDTLLEILVRAAATVWVLGFFVATHGALLKLAY